jgi:hypothetical protein
MTSPFQDRGEISRFTKMEAEIARLRAALDGALVVIESMPRPTAGLISNKVQADYDRRIAAIRKALANEQEGK